jgi:hypothetical protein
MSANLRQMSRWMVVILMVVIVAVIPGTASAGTSRCVDGLLCEDTLVGGTIKTVCSGTCTSSGSGSTTCTPGAMYSYLKCYGDYRQWFDYVCTDDGQWQLYRTGDRIDGVCKDDEACYSPDGQPVPPEECYKVNKSETPCEDLDWGASGVQCNGAYNLSVSVTVPCQRISRMPYPRGLVASPVNLSFSPDANVSWVQNWSQTLDYHECMAYGLKQGKRMIRNYRIGLAWGRIDGMAPRWELQEAGGGNGFAVSAVWQKSSFFGDECGPGLNAGDVLPAFRGRLYTSWTAYYRVQYELQKTIKECHTDGGCEERGDCRYACDRGGWRVLAGQGHRMGGF